MKIAFIEIQNFRKLKSTRIDFSSKETILVGANNSGKTTAINALGHFLINPNRFTINDFTLSDWETIAKIGTEWENSQKAKDPYIPTIDSWEKIVPMMDVWLDVKKNEVHHVSHLLPTLDWKEGKLGVRLRYEPTNINELYSDYLKARSKALEVLQAANDQNKDAKYELKLWPESLLSYLEKRLRNHFKIQAYTIDPDKLKNVEKNGYATLQQLPKDILPLEQSPFDGLIQIDEINAQRGFADVYSTGKYDDTVESNRGNSAKYKLSEQMRSYYSKHIDPSDSPEPEDIAALHAIEEAQTAFDLKLKDGFKDAIHELEKIGYPGITDPRVTIATRVRPIEGLNHPSALQYQIYRKDVAGSTSSTLKLPEQYNGLGYQNLISIMFRLMSFRDDWMQVGKAKAKLTTEVPIAPIHLVIVEEPEAHLHVQVQQVFIRKAYEVLRNNKELENNDKLCTQLIVSTHSSHIAHECKFATLRYFRRLPAIKNGDVPISTVVNLSHVFGEENETERFVTRYLRTTHSDLFFADAAIFVEGPAEKILVPYFIEISNKKLQESYLTIIEIGGSHSHTLQPLIEHLGLTTLIITDIDSVGTDGKKAMPARGASLKTNNTTLKNWLPKFEDIDKLIDLPEIDKEKEMEEMHASIRVAYQTPIKIKLAKKEEEAIPYTFEDALVLENIHLFKNGKGIGLFKKFKAEIEKNTEATELSAALFEHLKDTCEKAKFALDILFLADGKNLNTPSYIKNGLLWLEEKLKKHNDEILPSIPKAVSNDKTKPAEKVKA